MTKFKHAIFISYRNGKSGDLLKTFAKQLCEALRYEMDALDIGDIENPIFLDQEINQGGAFINTLFSEALYHSCTMIVIFTPNYFSTDKPFCSSEFEGMLRRESKFNGILNSEKKYIVPIILRGKVNLIPEVISKRTYYTEFCNFDPELDKKVINNHPILKPKVREIAECIEVLCTDLRINEGMLCDDCTNFNLLNENTPELIEFIRNVKNNTYKPEFPVM